LVYENVRMITSSPTKRISAISQWKHLSVFYPQDGGESLLASRLRHCHLMYSRYTYFFLLAPSLSRPAWARTLCRYYGNNSLGLARRRETEFYQYFIKDIRRLHDGTAGGGGVAAAATRDLWRWVHPPVAEILRREAARPADTTVANWHFALPDKSALSLGTQHDAICERFGRHRSIAGIRYETMWDAVLIHDLLFLPISTIESGVS